MSANDIITITLSEEDWTLLRAIAEKDDMTKQEIKWAAIAQYMNDEIREQVHAELAPCSNAEFLKRYLELDPGFEQILDAEFVWRDEFGM